MTSCEEGPVAAVTTAVFTPGPQHNISTGIGQIAISYGIDIYGPETMKLDGFF